MFNNLKQRQINQIDAKPKANSRYSCNSLLMTTIFIWNQMFSAIDLCYCLNYLVVSMFSFRFMMMVMDVQDSLSYLFLDVIMMRIVVTFLCFCYKL